MYISLVAKSKTHHTIHIVDREYDKKLPNFLRTYTQEALKLEKHTPFMIGLYPQIVKSTITYHIIIHVKNMKKFDHHVEDIIAELGVLIKKTKQTFFLDLDTTIISHKDKELLQELLIINLYAFTKYKKEKKLSYHIDIKNSHTDKNHFAALMQSLTITRELIDDPSNSIHPQTVEDVVHKFFGKHKSIKIQTIKGKELEKKWLNGIYQVGKWSINDPRLLIIHYKGNKSENYDFALIGKWVCFDTGGYNIKLTGSMEGMKVDMAGAATVIGILNYIVTNNIQKNIIIWLPLVENMVSHNAYKPGDVITMYNGKTVEVGNTDAEGRLILADSLSYIEEKYNPDIVFDFATLTGAQIVALGNRFAAIMGRNSKLNREIQDLGEIHKDRVRELPFYQPYFKAYKSDIADMNNMSTIGKMGPGTIGAWLFLSQFIENKNRVHFDIAGPASIAGDPLTGWGATGCMVRLVIYLLTK
jgi:leucyl aminopeptidase